jgi:E3 ubiquitin-protein ligase RFWD2
VSSDYEGVIRLWDSSVGAFILNLDEHEKRAWSVDFSSVSPTHVASGGDDTKVKFWSTNQRRSTGTIETNANVCAVKYHPFSPFHFAFGSSDHHVHYYDLRRIDQPLYIFKGHRKAVSYVKFLDSSTMVTASTDCSLRLWNYASTDSTEVTQCARIYSGHINEKSFVGLSISSDGEYFACGSETNQVHAYHHAIRKPILSHRFEHISDPITVS